MALIETYGCNPYRIVKTGYRRFSARMRKSAPRSREESLQRLWDDAQSSVHTGQPEEYVATLESHFHQLISDWQWQKERKDDLIRRMIETLNRLKRNGSKDSPCDLRCHQRQEHGEASGRNGTPLGDFPHWRTLMRYAGLNIRMR
jgi:hypothetical protein